MGAALYSGKVMHARFLPRRRHFEYRVSSLLLDVARLEETAGSVRLLSLDRFNLFGFYRQDHGPCDGSDLHAWASRLLAEHGVKLDGGRIELLCFPRVLGYVFNPLSLWFCYGDDSRLRAVIYEVRNTFGEKHHYLVREPDGSPLTQGSWHAADKVFHVSPFLGMNMQYRFLISPPDERLRVLIDEYEYRFDGAPGDGRKGELQRILVASLGGRRKPLTDSNLLRNFLSMPLMTFKVVAMIHWQAAKLWLSGVKFHRKPAPPAHEVTETCKTNNR